MDALHAQLDLFLTGGTYHNATCRYADYVHPSQPLYPARITSYTIDHELPDPLLGGVAKRAASITLSDQELNRMDAPTIAAILATENPKGKRARLRLWDPETSQYVMTVHGIISSLGQDYRSLTIEGEDPALLQKVIPTERVLEYFSSADVSFVESKDPPPIVVFGPMPRVTLPLAMATSLAFEATIGGADANKFVYIDLTHIPDYTVGVGDVLVYGLYLNAPGTRIGVDLRCTDTTTLRDAGGVDQNGLSSHPNTLLDAYAAGKFYRREIDLTALWGKTINTYILACENDTAGAYGGSIENAYIVDSTGTKKVTLHDETSPAPTFVYLLQNNGISTATLVRSSSFFYGPIRTPTFGVLTAPHVYVDGRVRSSATYAIITLGPHSFLSFAERPFGAQGRSAPVQADLDSTEFARNPVAVLQYVWNNAAMLGRPTNAASFDAAFTALAAIGDYTKVVGGLAERKPALQILRDLSFRGITFDLNDSGEITISMDSAAAHGTAPVNLGSNDALRLHNAELETNNALSNSIVEQTKQLDFLAYRDPGLGGNAQPSYLISATRARTEGGATITKESPYCGTGKMADRETDYLFKTLSSLDLDIQVRTGQQIGKQLSLGQLVRFYSPKHYFSGAQYVIRRRRFDGRSFSLRLTGYDPATFTYAAGKVTASRLVDSFVDFSFTTPSSPTSPTYMSSTIFHTSDGRTASIEKFRVTLPSTNVSELHLFAFRSGTGQVNPFRTVLKKTIALGATNDIEVEVPPGMVYDVEFYAVNGGNHPDFRYSPPALITGRVAAGDLTAPGTPTGLALADQPPRALRASWVPAADTDVEHFRVDVATDAGFSANLTIRYAKSTEIVLPDLVPGQTYWVRVRAEDWSKNPGAYSTAQSRVVPRVATDDITDQAVNYSKLGFLSVGTATIIDLSVSTAKIIDLAVNNAKIADLAVETGKIADLAVSNAKIANLAVNTAKIANVAVDTAKIADLAVTTGKIANLAVDNAKIVNLAVTTGKIANLAVDTLQIAGQAVTTGKRQFVFSQSAGYTISHGDQQVQQFTHSIGTTPLATGVSGDSGIQQHVYAMDATKIWFNKKSLYAPSGSVTSTFEVYYW